VTNAWKAIEELYKHAVAEGALSGTTTLDADTIAASIPESARDVERALRELDTLKEGGAT
jgi:hypothetical protein